MTDFKSFGIPDALLQSLERLSITIPTPIQAESIPISLEGKDVLGSAQTGTGKTLAYLIPVCTYLLASPQNSALVMTPTRELAIQVRDMLEKLLAKKPQFENALLIGGDPMAKQLGQLRRRPQLIIGTPGRINDHLNRGSLLLNQSQFLVLDETDRMLDMGFSEQLETIIEVMHPTRQTLMFSATMPSNIVRIANQYLKDPKRITMGSTTQPVTHIKQDIIYTSHSEKFTHLLRELNEREGSVIVFVKTKLGAEDLKDRLCDEQHLADAIHGDLHQRKRERVVKSFRANKSRIMVATDIAARGLDVPHIRHVINYDLPQCPEDYIHRIGRTGRAGAEGSALCLLAPDDRNKWRAISQLMNPGAPIEFPKGMKPEGREGRSDGQRRRSGGFGGGYGSGSPRPGGRPGGFGGGQGYRGDRPFGDRPRSAEGGERRPFAGDRSFNSDRPRSTEGGERRPFAGDRSFNSDRPRSTEAGERRPFAGDRPFNSDRPRSAEAGERRPFGGERRPFGGDRPNRGKPGEGRGGESRAGDNRGFGPSKNKSAFSEKRSFRKP